jgi:hypothetical protein
MENGSFMTQSPALSTVPYKIPGTRLVQLCNAGELEKMQNVAEGERQNPSDRIPTKQ